ncbi:MAG TPA: hypothetical protein VEC60_20610, partial [Reyranella sp.]|nr:hypothetical protein [Reyranella sp.]
MEPQERFHSIGNARTGDARCSRHIPSGRFRPNGICSSLLLALTIVAGALPASAQIQFDDFP